MDHRSATPADRPRIRVLIVEDSPVAQQLLAHILGSDPAIEVVGAVAGGRAALELMERLKPDVITMDVNMPEMDGFEVTRRIMESRPVPVVIISASFEPDEVATTFRAIEAGAVAVIGKPRGAGPWGDQDAAQKLVQTVRAMAEVKVVRRWSRNRRPEGAAAGAPGVPVAGAGRSPVPSPTGAAAVAARRVQIRLVAVGASTGGPLVLQTLLAGLPRDFAATVVIVQHIAAGFLPGLVTWLGSSTGFPIHVATQGEALLPGHAYLAPDALHMGVSRDGRVILKAGPPDNGLRPSVSHLFASVAEAYGAAAAGVLLTGMGRDGAEELRLMRQKGAITIAQDQASSVVFGMPGEAVKLDAALHVLPPERIAALLAGLVGRG